MHKSICHTLATPDSKHDLLDCHVVLMRHKITRSTRKSRLRSEMETTGIGKDAATSYSALEGGAQEGEVIFAAAKAQLVLHAVNVH